jgi:hypothetical protein
MKEKKNPMCIIINWKTMYQKLTIEHKKENKTKKQIIKKWNFLIICFFLRVDLLCCILYRFLMRVAFVTIIFKQSTCNFEIKARKCNLRLNTIKYFGCGIIGGKCKKCSYGQNRVSKVVQITDLSLVVNKQDDQRTMKTAIKIFLAFPLKLFQCLTKNGSFLCQFR